jgi:hypothetical protein
MPAAEILEVGPSSSPGNSGLDSQHALTRFIYSRAVLLFYLTDSETESLTEMEQLRTVCLKMEVLKSIRATTLDLSRAKARS